MNNVETGEKQRRVFSVDGEEIYLSAEEFRILGTEGALLKYSVFAPEGIRKALETLDWLQSPRSPRDFKERLLGALDTLSKARAQKKIMPPIVERYLNLKSMKSSLAREELTVEDLMQQFFPPN